MGIETGHHVVDDTATRTSTVAYFDGVHWWLPGSERAFAAEDFAADGRFQVKSPVAVTSHAYGSWDVEYGRHP